MLLGWYLYIIVISGIYLQHIIIIIIVINMVCMHWLIFLQILKTNNIFPRFSISYLEWIAYRTHGKVRLKAESRFLLKSILTYVRWNPNFVGTIIQ